MNQAIYASDFKESPYWWEAAPRRQIDEAAIALPPAADVAVVGSGFTGLSAAFTLARHGRDVIVLEAETPGYGASTRNHGYIGTALFKPFNALVKRYGIDRTAAFTRESCAAFKYVTELIEKEQIQCHFKRGGRVYWAYNRKQFEDKARELELMQKHVGIEGYTLGPGDVRKEIGSDFYYGGIVFPTTAQCHPALYHSGLLDRAESAGARVVGKTPVLAIERDGSGFAVRTPRGVVKAGDVIVATNGYAGAETPYFRRRVIPVNGHICATEPLPEELLNRMFPTGRTFLDLRSSFHSWCIAPDGPRLLFLGQTARPRYMDRRIPERIHKEMQEVYPELADVRFTHYWNGQMGFAFDYLPHVGAHDGIHYAMCMNGTGIPMGTFLGNKVALRVLGEPDSATAFDGESFRTMPFYSGRPWFMPMVASTMQWLGRHERRS